MPPGHVTQDCPISTLHSFGWLSNRFNKDKMEDFCETSGKVCASPGVRLETSSLGMLKTLVSRTKSTFLGIKTHHKSGTGRRGSNLLRSHLKTTTTTTTFKKCRGGGRSAEGPLLSLPLGPSQTPPQPNWIPLQTLLPSTTQTANDHGRFSR